MISKDNKKQLIYLILAILWGYLIFYLSSIPNLASGFSFYYDFFTIAFYFKLGADYG